MKMNIVIRACTYIVPFIVLSCAAAPLQDIYPRKNEAQMLVSETQYLEERKRQFDRPAPRPLEQKPCAFEYEKEIFPVKRTLHWVVIPDYELYEKLYRVSLTEADKERLNTTALDQIRRQLKFYPKDAGTVRAPGSGTLEVTITTEQPVALFKQEILKDYHTFSIQLVDEDLSVKLAEYLSDNNLKFEYRLGDEFTDRQKKLLTAGIGLPDTCSLNVLFDLMHIRQSINVQEASGVLDKMYETHVHDRVRYLLRESDSVKDFRKARHYSLNYTGNPDLLPLIVHRKVELDGADIRSAVSDTDFYGETSVRIETTDEGAGKLRAMTAAENLGKRAAIILDDCILSAPVIVHQGNRNFSFTGSFAEEEGWRVAQMLSRIAARQEIKLKILSEKIVEHK